MAPHGNRAAPILVATVIIDIVRKDSRQEIG